MKEVLKYFIPAIGATYFTSTMTYMIGITKGKTDMYNQISEEYNLIPKDKNHFLYDSRLKLLDNNAVDKSIAYDNYEHLA